MPQVLFKHSGRYRCVSISKSRMSDVSDIAKDQFNHFEGCRCVNFPQVSGPRSQVHLRFCLGT